nr:amino acid adenylation domain-containing protein [Myxococcaceae bacterium MCy9487]
MDDLLKQLQLLPPAQREQILQKLARRQPASTREKASAESAIPRVARQPRMPLSFAQQRLWFLCQFEGQSIAYNIPGVLRLEGPLRREALEEGLNTLVQRHEALRASFRIEADSPIQVIVPELVVPLLVVDLQGLAGAAQGEEIQRLATQEARTPFSLDRPPLLRLTLLRLAPESHVLLLTFHHIVFDGWSIHLFVQELTHLYAASMNAVPGALPELAIQYVDFACWQREWLRGEKQETQLAYWKKQLTGAPAQVTLPTDRPRPPVQSFRGDAVAFHIGRRLTQQLKTLGEKTGATLFMVLLGAFAGLLHRYRAGDDLVVGTPIANRGRRELESLIGFFVNTLALRIDLSGDPSFHQLVERVRRVTLDAYTHQDLPFERLVEELHPERNLSSNPVVQVLFALQNTPAGQVELPGLIVTPLEMPAVSAKFDLTLLMEETAEGLRGWLEFSTDLFEPATLRRMAAHYENLLAGVATHAHQPLSALPLLTRAEEQQVVEEWNRTGVEYPELDCLHSLIEAQVRRTPEAVALVFEEQSLTYRQLDERANQLAWHLLSLGVGPECTVALCLERSLEMVIALLGVLKAGAAYVPLDPSYPPERLAFMLSDCAAPVLLTQRALASTLPASSSALRLFLDEAAPLLALQPSHAPALPLSQDSLAYVIYTSGSTGQPKGAMNCHRAVANRLLWMQHTYRLAPDDCVLQKTPFSFDVSVWEFFWPLLCGARLVIARPGGHQDSSYLAHLIHRQRITTLHFVPSMLRAFLEHPDLSGCSSLRRVFCSGEGLPAELQSRFSLRLSSQLHNLYGPTEAAIDVTAWHCSLPSPTPIVPLGSPVANTQVYVLDSHLRPVPPGVPGELFLAGIQLARGYLHRPALTAERFIPDPISPRPGSRLYRTGDLARWLPSGVLEFLGRLDDQIKLRGLRIELGEIEAVLSLHPAVSQCVVLARSDSPDRLQLVAYLAPRTDSAVIPHELQQFLLGKLPDYMVPAFFVLMEAIPLSPNGKVDRRALPAPILDPQSRAEPSAQPRSPTEEALATIWGHVLGMERIGLNDNFFELGGDSILGIRIITAARAIGLELALPLLFQHQTLQALALAAEQGPNSIPERPRLQPFGLVPPEERERLPSGLEDAYPLATLQAGMLFHSELRPDTPVYHDVFSYHLRAQLDADKLLQAIRELIHQHPILRTGFALSGFKQPLQCVHTQAEPSVGFAELGHLEPPEQDAAVEEWSLRERATPFDWARPPLLRFQVHRRGPEGFTLSLGFHHAILDGWSVATLITELLQRYLGLMGLNAGAPQPPLRQHYRDFIALEQQALASDAHKAFWKERLAEMNPARLPRWPGDRSAKVGTQGELEVPISDALSQGLRKLAGTAGVPIKSVLLAAHLKVLRLLSEQRRVMTGIVAHGRMEEVDGERVMGLFLNTLPFVMELPAGTWIELARQVFQVERASMPFRRLPLAEIQRQAGGQTLFETVFNFAHFHVYRGVVEQEGIEFAGGKFFEQTHFTLAANFQLDVFGRQVRLRLSYDAGELDAQQVERMGGYYARALEAMASQPEGRHESASLLTRAEEQQVVEEWNRTGVEYPELDCLHSLIEAQVRRTPEAVALVFEEQSLTYRQLDERANQLAWHLLSLGVGPECTVALCLERSLEMVIALLGVLKAGAAYVPLDPSYPPERLAFMLSDCAAPVLLTQRALASTLPASSSALRLFLDEAAPLLALQPSHAPALPLSQDSLAYVIYTSGSTGQPKGAMNCHRAVANRLLWMQHTYRLAPDDCVLQKTPFSFDVSVWEFFWPLLCGARLVIARPGGHQDSSYLAHLIHRQRITTLHFVPSMLRAFLEHPDLSGCSSLRRVFCSGEGLPAELQSRFSLRLSSQLHNLYGPTEAAIDVTAWHCSLPSPTPIVPLGSPVANTQVYVLDSHLRPVPPGVPGELFLAGIQLARGYLHRPALTAERFIPDPFSPRPGSRLYRTGDLARWLPSGVLEFLGRLDDQIKLRGLRIELGEIEAVLSLHPAVSQCVVLARSDSPEHVQLVAYAVPSQEQAHPLLRRVRWQKEGRLDEATLRELPNGMAISHLNPGETDFLYEEIFQQRGYLRHGVTLRDGDCVFDVGANIGLFTLFAAQQARDIRVFAFEPIPRIFDKLRMNLALHGVEAVPIEAGLSREQGRATFTYYPHVSIVSGRFADEGEERAVVAAYLHGQQSTSPGTSPDEARLVEELLTSRLRGEQVDCQLRTVSDVMREHAVERIDLLKVDVEKSEADVLAGIAPEDWPRIRQVVVEVHDKDGRLEELTRLLKQQGFELIIEEEEGLQNSGLHGIWAWRTEDSDDSRRAPPRVPEQHAPLPWSSPRLWAEALRQTLSQKLPGYMVPEFFVPLDALPLSPSGKLDRRALPAPNLSALRQGRELVLPRTPDEQLIASIWQGVLGIAEIGVDESFFRLGGHSLLATQVLSRLRDALQIELPLQLLFDAPTVATLAQALAAHRQSAASQPAPTAIPRLSRDRHRAKSLPPTKPGT